MTGDETIFKTLKICAIREDYDTIIEQKYA